MVRAIFGADAHSAEIKFSGKPYKARSPTDAIHHGIALVTEDRKGQGLFLKQDVTLNITISGIRQFCRGWIIQRAKEAAQVRKMIEDLRIKTPNASFIVVNMSGGNQQKVILARWLSVDTKILIMDEPTRGIDVGSKSEIYQIMDELTKRGVGIIDDLLRASRDLGHERSDHGDAGGDHRRRGRAPGGQRGDHHEVCGGWGPRPLTQGRFEVVAGFTEGALAR